MPQSGCKRQSRKPGWNPGLSHHRRSRGRSHGRNRSRSRGKTVTRPPPFGEQRPRRSRLRTLFARAARVGPSPLARMRNAIPTGAGPTSRARRREWRRASRTWFGSNQQAGSCPSRFVPPGLPPSSPARLTQRGALLEAVIEAFPELLMDRQISAPGGVSVSWLHI